MAERIGATIIRFLFYDLYTKKPFKYGIFSTITDAKGKEIEVGTDEEKGTTRLGLDLPMINRSQNSLTIDLSDYPKWIKGIEKIRNK